MEEGRSEELQLLRDALQRLSVVERDNSEILGKLDSLMLGFPGGDMDGHRRYHEGVIEWQETRSRLVRAALEKVVGAGAVAGTAWVLYALWVAFRMELHK